MNRAGEVADVGMTIQSGGYTKGSVSESGISGKTSVGIGLELVDSSAAFRRGRTASVDRFRIGDGGNICGGCEADCCSL